ncbi:MAG: D-2-hydroxyacid dehydrogenase [Bacteroidales bacterium]|nr:D-2-hydroxyacid dehydrogenase [Bacteroidales bacterium]
MNIVILDGYTANPGDLSWDAFNDLGKVTVYEHTPPSLTRQRALDADAVLTNKTIFTRDLLSSLPQLKYIGVLATGYNVVDIEAANERGITVTNIPAYSTASVAQLTFAHILNLTHHSCEHSKSVKEGKWSSSRDFCFWDFPLIELAGMTIGIIGAGRIGLAVAEIAIAFKMKVLAYDLKPPEQIPESLEFVSTEHLFNESDIISLHCPLTKENEKIINALSLKKMKASAFLINTSRGGLIDEPALAEALNDGIIAGAGLDVLTQEPPLADNPLLKARNCYITPHIAWASFAARTRLLRIAEENLRSFIDGNPVNMVNK